MPEELQLIVSEMDEALSSGHALPEKWDEWHKRLQTLAHTLDQDPDAFLFQCQKGGLRTEFASVDQFTTEHWPLDQWKKITMLPLYTKLQMQNDQIRQTRVQSLLGAIDVLHNELINQPDHILHSNEKWLKVLECSQNASPMHSTEDDQ